MAPEAGGTTGTARAAGAGSATPPGGTPTARRGLGFSAGAATRLAAAALYAVLAVAAVLAVERLARPRAPVAPTAAVATARPATLSIAPTFAVGRWLVMADGRELPATRSDAMGWQAEVDLAALGRSVLVEAEPAAESAQPGALRVEFRAAGATSHQVVWGEGLISGTVAVPP